MASYPLVTYTNLKHKVITGLSNGSLVIGDESITPVFSKTTENILPFKVSFVSPYNQITGTFTANRALNAFEVRISPAEETSYGPGEGICAFSIVGIAGNTSNNFIIPINSATCLCSPSNTYRICLLAQSELDYSWDCTQLYMVIDTNTSFTNTYTEVEFLKSTGTQYIDTGLGVSSSIKVEITLLPTVQGVDERFFGAYDNGIFLGQLASKWRYGSTCEKNDIAIDYATKTTVTANGAAWTFNGVEKTASTIGNRGNRMLIFGASYRSDALYGAGRCQIYTCKIWDGANLVRNFVPCIRNSDNKPGMYDRVNNVFYTNQGSGEFLYGPLKSVPQKYQQVNYIESSGKQYIDTNFVPLISNTWKIEADVSFHTSDVRQAIFGSYGRNNSTNNYLCCEITAGNKFRLVSYNEDRNSSATMAVNKLYKLIVYNDANKAYLRIMGENTDETTDYVTLIDNNNSELLFKDYRDNIFTLESIRLYSFKISNNTGPVRHLVPCYRKADNIAGMFDLVGNQFYRDPESTINLGDISATYTNFNYNTSYNLDSWGGNVGTAKFFGSGGYENAPYYAYYKTTNGTSGGSYKDTADNMTIEAGKKYTMSIYVKASREVASNSEYLFTLNRHSDNYYITYNSQVNLTTDWQRLTKTFTASAAQAGNYCVRNIIYTTVPADTTVYFSGFQLELNDHATPFALGTRDFSKGSNENNCNYLKYTPTDYDSYEVHCGGSAQFSELWLISCPSSARIQTIKLIRSMTGLALKEAKDLVEICPCCIYDSTNNQEFLLDKYDEYASQFEACGAAIELR